MVRLLIYKSNLCISFFINDRANIIDMIVESELSIKCSLSNPYKAPIIEFFLGAYPKFCVIGKCL